MQLSQKEKYFFDFFTAFWNLIQILTFYKRMDDSHTSGISEITDSEKHGYINV